MQVSTLDQSSLEILKKVSIFADVKADAQAMSIISAMMTKRSFAAGQTLIEQGSAGEEFYVLMEGTVSISKQTAEGDSYKVVVLTHQNHPSFGEGGLMEGEVRSASIKCDSAVQCLVLSKQRFDDFCKQYPQYALPVFKKIAQGLMARLNQTSHDLMLLHKALMNEIRNT